MKCAHHFLLSIALVAVFYSCEQANGSGLYDTDDKLGGRDATSNKHNNNQNESGEAEHHGDHGLYGAIARFADGSSDSKIECPYTKELYDELRMAPINTKNKENGLKLKGCAVPGCFYLHPPKGNEHHFFTERHNFHILEGCRSDIPYLIQRAPVTKDTRLRNSIRYLRGCFVGKKDGRNIKQCQQQDNSTKPNFKHDSLYRGVELTEGKCFYAFNPEPMVYYVSFGGKNTGRVICCGNGENENDFKTKTCKPKTESIYAAKNGWRKGKDGKKGD